MFIIIPFIIIFVLFAYIQINDDLTTFEVTIIYVLMIITIIISLITYIKIKKDFAQQEKNSLILEIFELNKKLNHTEDENLRNSYQHKIDNLEEELKKLNNR